MFGPRRVSSLLAFSFSLFMSFTTAGAVDLDPATHQAVPGDFNGDGRLDALMQPLVETGQGGILLQDGTGNLSVVAQGWNPGYLGLDWSVDKGVVTAADLNGDGLDDVVVQPRTAGNNASVLITDPTIQLLNIAQIIPANYLGLDWSSAGHLIVPGDFDGDHQKELLLQTVSAGGPSAIVHADQAGHLVAITQSIPDGYLGRRWDANDVTLYVGDLNGDGRQDLLMQVKAGAQKAGESAYALLLADENGRFTQISQVWNTDDLGADWSPATHTLSLQDLNGTGAMSIVLTAKDASGTNYVFQPNAQGTFSKPVAKWTGPSTAHDVMAKQQTGSTGISVVVTPSGVAKGQGLKAADTTNSPAGMTMSLVTGSGLATPTAFGSMGGQSGAEGGSASYSIPIAVPPGIAGMQPSLSLNYSSQGGNGEVGIGWSLSGASAIHRCPATYAQDGYTQGVTYIEPYDRLCLDGQHLIQVSPGVYRTERDSSVRVTLTGDINTSGSSFEVDYQDGRKSYYGSSPYTVAAFAAQSTVGTLPALVWAITQTDDPAGNNVVYEYTSYGSGEYHLSQIIYTGSTSGSTIGLGNREVDLNYTQRTDPKSTYLAGGLTRQTELLTQITTKVNGTEVSQYSLSYSPSLATGRSLLRSVQECAYATGSSTPSCLPPDTFSWQEPVLSYNSPNAITQPSGVSTQSANSFDDPQNQSFLSVGGDYNGDGQNELIYSPVGSDGFAFSLDGSLQIDFGAIYKNGNNYLSATDDFVRNGLMEPLGLNQQGELLVSLCNPQTPCTNENNYSAPMPTGISLGNSSGVNLVTGEFRGDGLPDVVGGNANDPHAIYFYQNVTQAVDPTTGNPVPSFTSGVKLASLAPVSGCVSSFYQNITQIGDLDGNGIPDLLITGDCEFNTTPMAIAFMESVPYKGSILTGATVETLSQLGITTNVTNLNYYFADINGDGLKDFIYLAPADDGSSGTSYTWHYQINQGGGVGFLPEVDTKVIAGNPLADKGVVMPFGSIQVSDFTGEGKDEFLVPVSRVSTYCLINRYTSEGVTQTGVFCGDSITGSTDYSVYKFQVLKFVEQQDGSYAPTWATIDGTPTGTPISVNAEAYTVTAGDLYGTGLTDVFFLSSPWYQNGQFNLSEGCPNGVGAAPCEQPLAYGYYAITPRSGAPDLMTGAVNGLGAQAAWQYDSLADLAKLSTPAYIVDERPCTTAPKASGQLPEYYCFASSMWVVSSYRVSNGVSGNNEYTYQYKDAVYEDEGRGFQGFQSITVNDLAAGTYTVNTYHQDFPLSGMLKESTTYQNGKTTPLSDTNDSWQMASPTVCLPSSSVFWPQLKQSTVIKNNTDGTQISDTNTSYGYDGYGNTTSVSATTTDSAGSYTNSTTDTYPTTQDCTDWWTDQLSQKVVTSSVTYNAVTPNNGMSIPQSQSSIPRTAAYPDYDTTLRKVKTEKDDQGTSFEKDTAYTYDVFGNTASVKVSTPDAVPTGTLDPTQDYGFAARTTATAYTTDSVSAGYFVQTVTDPMGHVTAIKNTDLATGQPLTVTAADGVVTNYTYDAFGRKATEQVGDMNPVDYTFAAPASECPSNTVYSYSVFQLGNTTKTTCSDMLDRIVQTITAGFVEGNDVYQATTYDALGHAIQVSEPYLNSDYSSTTVPYCSVVTYCTTYSYDVLNRVTNKVDAKDVNAVYTYGVNGNPLETQIVVTPPDSPAYTTYETHNSLGKMLSTIDANTSETDFRYDAGGNPTLIQDAANNQTVATFNILGQKTGVTDPDMGSWTYAYDVLGELLQQTDAKNQQITMGYDPLGRMTSKSSNALGEGVTIWTYDSYANCSNGIGKLCNVTQYDGYSETDSYDQNGMLASTDEDISGSDYITSTAYDTDGRVSIVTYPATIADAAPVITSLTANGASSATVLVNDPPVTLAGAATDADETATTTTQYQWSVVSNTCPCTPTLSSTTSPTTQFTPSLPGIYTFMFTATDGLRTTSSNVTVTVQPQAPGAVSINTNTGFVGSYVVNWSAANGASAYNPSYNLYQSEDGAPFTLVACPTCAQLAQSFTGMGSQTSNTTYTYEAKALANGVEGPASSVASTTVYYPPTEPTPQTLPAQSAWNRTFIVSWAASTGVSPGYTVKTGIPDGDAPTVWNKGSCNTTSTSCTITETADGTYVAEVSSCNESACNQPVQAPGSVNVWHLTAPAAPTVNAPSLAGGTVTPGWSAPTNATSYQLWQESATKTGAWSGWTEVYSGTARSYTVTMSVLRYYYGFYAVACDAAGCSGGSAPVVVTNTNSNQYTGGGGQDQIIIAPPPPGTSVAPAPASSSLKKPRTPENQTPVGGPTAAVSATRRDEMLAIKSMAQVKAPRAAAAARVASTRTFDFAPPIYKAYADAHLEAAASTTTLVGVTVLYHYNNTGHLNRVENAKNTNQVFWEATGVNARDQVTDEQYGVNGSAATITSHRDYYPESGYVENIQSTNSSAVTLQSMHYMWQELGNLVERQSMAQPGITLSETFTYDILNRVTSAQVSNGAGPQPAVTYGYDPLGNLTCKSDVTNTICGPTSGGYTYGGQLNAGPHAVTSTVAGGSYGYDPNGNMSNRNATTIGWNSDNLPTSIVQDANNTSAFNYAPDKHRVYQSALVNGLPETTVYAGDLEIVTDATGTHNRYQLSAYGRSVAIVDLETASGPVINTQYLMTDHLGSVDVAADTTGAVVGGTGWNFGTFGNRRDATTWQTATSNSQTIADRTTGMSNNMSTGVTHRGHTNHEMLDNVGLVHANGRVYDPMLGRFLSVDPVFAAPTNTQSLNPYSYVMNNPLSLVDPSGYCASAVDNENAANTSVCGQGDNDAGNHEYSGKNGNDGGTGSHAGFQSGFNGQDLHSLANGHLSNLFASVGIKLDSNTRVLGGQFENGAKFGQGIDDTQHLPGGASDIGSPKTVASLTSFKDNLNVTWSDSGNSRSAELDGIDAAYGGRGFSFWTQNQNPSPQEYEAELGAISAASGMPARALNALYGTESDRTQFSGNRPILSSTGAVGMSQILPHTAGLYGIDYVRAATDWRYNMESGAKIYQAGYDHPWNADAANDRFHAIRGYDFYHDNWNNYRQNFGISGAAYERSYMDHYDNDN